MAAEVPERRHHTEYRAHARIPKDWKDDEGHDVYEINEEEAEIVRRIYREFIAGYSITQIAKRLQADGVKTKLGRESWRHNVIESILTNEKYTGNALLGKTFKPDVLTKYRQKNDGKKAPIYYVEGSHPAIIEKGCSIWHSKRCSEEEMQMTIRSVAAGTAAAIHSAGCSYAVSADPSFAGRYEQWAVESGRHHGVAAIG